MDWSTMYCSSRQLKKKKTMTSLRDESPDPSHSPLWLVMTE